jgi:dienelactone hydrolase
VTRRAIALFFVLAMTAVSVGGVMPTAAASTQPVGVRTVTLVDRTRATPDGPGGDGHPERRLETTVYYPARGDGGRGAPAAKGRFPLVVFSHGTATDATTYDALLRRWAAAGYVVAAPAHPLSRLGAPGGSVNDDRDAQPGDQSFLIDTLTGGSAPRWLRGHVDEERIAVAGHSLGAYTALETGYGECCVDERIDAVISFAGLGLGHRGGVADDPDAPPLLLVHDRADPDVPVRFSEDVFEAATGRRFLVLLAGGRAATAHLDAYVAGSRPESRLVAAATVDWLDWALQGDADALERFWGAVAARPGLADLREAG